jgi:hypothetical protein
MKAYPYHTSERYPDSEPYRRYQQEYNTRRVPAVIGRLGGGF